MPFVIHGFNVIASFIFSYLPGLFPGKLATTVFNNKIKSFEKAGGLFRALKVPKCSLGSGGVRL